MSIETVCAFGVCVCVLWGGGVQCGGRGLCYVALLQGSPVSAGFHHGNLIFRILCYTVE